MSVPSTNLNLNLNAIKNPFGQSENSSNIAAPSAPVFSKISATGNSNSDYQLADVFERFSQANSAFSADASILSSVTDVASAKAVDYNSQLNQANYSFNDYANAQNTRTQLSRGIDTVVQTITSAKANAFNASKGIAAEQQDVAGLDSKLFEIDGNISKKFNQKNKINSSRKSYNQAINNKAQTEQSISSVEGSISNIDQMIQAIESGAGLPADTKSIKIQKFDSEGNPIFKNGEPVFEEIVVDPTNSDNSEILSNLKSSKTRLEQDLKVLKENLANSENIIGSFDQDDADSQMSQIDDQISELNGKKSELFQEKSKKETNISKFSIERESFIEQITKNDQSKQALESRLDVAYEMEKEKLAKFEKEFEKLGSVSKNYAAILEEQNTAKNKANQSGNEVNSAAAELDLLSSKDTKPKANLDLNI